ncbi:MAG: VOC family protein, partial [Stackebrandtia sp.]
SYEGPDRHFAPVRVIERLTLDFMTVDAGPGHHLAFDVDPDSFDRIVARIKDRGVPFGDSPRDPRTGGLNHPLCPRGLFFTDDIGNLYEVMSPA